MVRMKRYAVFIVLTIVMLFSLTACGSADKSTRNSATDATEQKNDDSKSKVTSETSNNDKSESQSSNSAEFNGKVIVVYYSGTGNTKRVAEILANELKADTFELTPVHPYSAEDLNWGESSSRVNKEHDDQSLQDIELVSTQVPEWDNYNVVLFGYPIWWREASWVVNNFIKSNDFTGKTVIPFCSSTSSGLGDSGANLKKMAGNGNWLDGKRFNENPAEDSVIEWVRGLELE